MSFHASIRHWLAGACRVSRDSERCRRRAPTPRAPAAPADGRPPIAGCRRATPGRGSSSPSVVSSSSAATIRLRGRLQRLAAGWRDLAAAGAPGGVALRVVARDLARASAPTSRPGRSPSGRRAVSTSRLRPVWRRAAASSSAVAEARVRGEVTIRIGPCSSAASRAPSSRACSTPIGSSGGSRWPWKRPSRFQVVTPCRTSSRRSVTGRRRSAMPRRRPGWPGRRR